MQRVYGNWSGWLLGLCLAGSWVFASAQDEPAEPSRDLLESLEFVITKLMSEDAGIYVGMPAAKFGPWQSRATLLDGEYLLDLQDTPMCPTEQSCGLVAVKVSEDADIVDAVRLILWCDGTREVADHVRRWGRMLGVILEPTAANPFELVDHTPRRRQPRVILGPNAFVMELNFTPNNEQD